MILSIPLLLQLLSAYKWCYLLLISANINSIHHSGNIPHVCIQISCSCYFSIIINTLLNFSVILYVNFCFYANVCKLVYLYLLIFHYLINITIIDLCIICIQFPLIASLCNKFIFLPVAIDTLRQNKYLSVTLVQFVSTNISSMNIIVHCFLSCN